MYHFRAESTTDCQSWITTLRMAKTSALTEAKRKQSELQSKVAASKAPGKSDSKSSLQG